MTTILIALRISIIVLSFIGSGLAIGILITRHTSDEGTEKLEHEVQKFLAEFRSEERSSNAKRNTL